jgi:hypothetical protein
MRGCCSPPTVVDKDRAVTFISDYVGVIHSKSVSVSVSKLDDLKVLLAPAVSRITQRAQVVATSDGLDTFIVHTRLFKAVDAGYIRKAVKHVVLHCCELPQKSEVL